MGRGAQYFVRRPGEKSAELCFGPRLVSMSVFTDQFRLGKKPLGGFGLLCLGNPRVTFLSDLPEAGGFSGTRHASGRDRALPAGRRGPRPRPRPPTQNAARKSEVEPARISTPGLAWTPTAADSRPGVKKSGKPPGAPAMAKASARWRASPAGSQALASGKRSQDQM